MENDSSAESFQDHQFDPLDDEELITLRDEGIELMGLIHGSACKRAIWIDMQKFIDVGGIFYKALIDITEQNMEVKLALSKNKALFEQWKDKGLNNPLSPENCVDHFQLLVHTIRRISVLLEKRKIYEKPHRKDGDEPD